MTGAIAVSGSAALSGYVLLLRRRDGCPGRLGSGGEANARRG